MKNSLIIAAFFATTLMSVASFAYNPNGGAPAPRPAGGEITITGFSNSSYAEAMSNGSAQANSNGFRFEECRELSRFETYEYGEYYLKIAYLCSH